MYFVASCQIESGREEPRIKPNKTFTNKIVLAFIPMMGIDRLLLLKQIRLSCILSAYRPIANRYCVDSRQELSSCPGMLPNERIGAAEC
jgi:hypothetical protein